jgi:hypothetical protein
VTICCSKALAWLVIPGIISCQADPGNARPLREAGDEPSRIWDVSPDPTVSIGLAEGPPHYMFARITAVASRSDGGLILGDELAGVIRWYDQRGKFVAQVARRGSGPGEFRELTELVGTPSDTIVLWDATLRRITRYLPDGALHDIRRLELAPYVALAVPPYHLSEVSPLAGGDVLLRMGEVPRKDLMGKSGGGAKQSPPEGRFRRQAVVLRKRLGAAEADTVAVLLDREYETVAWPGLGAVQVDPYLSRRLLIASSRTTGAVCVGDQSTAAVTCVGSGGERQSISWDAHPVRVDPAHHSRWQDSLTGVLARKLESGQASALVRGMTVPDRMPPYVDLLLDGAERLWVQLPPLPGERGTSRYLAFGLSGRLLGRLELPFDRLLDADQGRVIGVLVDDDGLEYVRMHAIGDAR